MGVTCLFLFGNDDGVAAIELTRFFRLDLVMVCAGAFSLTIIKRNNN